jgi:uncharacterized membrane protein
MDAVVGLFCLLVLSIVGIGVGFWLMHQRISQLQNRLFEVELKLKQLDLVALTAPYAVARAVTPAPAILPEAAARPAQGASPLSAPETPLAVPATPLAVASASLAPPPVESAPARVGASPTPQPVAPAPQAPSTPRPHTLPPATSAPFSSAHATRKVTADLAKLPLIDWFLRMHLLVQIGLVVLLIGVALLLRYAVSQGWLSIELRHLGAAAGGAALGVAGWFAYKKQRGYGLALQGGGLAILYLTTFSAFHLYELLSAPVAFGGFVAISAFGIGLALLQDARLLAYVAMVGAFAAPILAGDGGGNYAGLLGYYAVVAVAALTLALRKGWQGLALLSLLGVYGVGILNSAAGFTPDDYTGTLAFVVFFFGLFLAASLLLALRPGAGRRVLDLVVAVLNPIAVLLWLAIVTDHTDKHLGYALAAGGVLYLAVFGALAWKRLDKLTAHRELSLFWGLFLLSLAVPIFVEARITASVWAVAGALWVWLSWRRGTAWLAFWGLLTQVAAGLFFAPTAFDALLYALEPAQAVRPYLNAFTLGWAILALAGMASAWLLERIVQREPRPAGSGLLHVLAMLTFVWGAAWWFGGGLLEATTVADGYVASAAVLFLALSTVLMDAIGQRLRFTPLSAPLWLLLPALAVLAIIQVGEINSPLQGGAWLVWPLALAAHVWMLRRYDGVAAVKFYHAGGVWLVAFLAVAATNGVLGLVNAAITLTTAATLSVLAAVAGAATVLAGHLPAPIGARAALYRLWGAAPVLGVNIAALVLATLTQDGAMTPFQYIPVLNPLALASAAVLGVTLVWIVVARKDVAEQTRTLIWSLRWAWWALLIFCLSAELARSLHHLMGMPLTWGGLYTTAIFQTLLAVLWSVIALGLMVWGSRRRSRSAWFAGASVLGLTVVKLFLVDLAGAGTVARIVSFIGVGLLILVIAFVAPAPPRKATAQFGAEQSPQ